MMAEQDQDLEELGAGVDRLNELGQSINQELQVQNQMLSDLDRDIDEVKKNDITLLEGAGSNIYTGVRG